MKSRITGLILLILIILTGCTKAPLTLVNERPAVDAKSVVVLNLDTSKIVFEKDGKEALCYPSYMTQIVTAIVAIEAGDNLDEPAVAIDKDTVSYFDGKDLPIAGLTAGEVYSLQELISLMMITNACDAALAVAKHISDGDVSAFVNQMNARVKSMGLEVTKFANPTGEHSENQYTNAYEMSVIGKYCMNIPGFTEMANRSSVQLSSTDNRSAKTFLNNNPMLIKDAANEYYYSKVQAISSAHDSKGGDSALTFASERGIRYLISILGVSSERPAATSTPADNESYAEDDEADGDAEEAQTSEASQPTDSEEQPYRGALLLTKTLYEWVYRTTDIVTAPENGKPVTEIAVSPEFNKTTLNLMLQKPITQYLPRNIAPSDVRLLLLLPGDIDRTVKKNEVLGTAFVMKDSTEIASIPLVAGTAVKEQGAVNPFIEFIKILLIILAAIVLLLFVIRYINIYRYRKRRRRRRPVSKPSGGHYHK